jgi:hypothetical protein
VKKILFASFLLLMTLSFCVLIATAQHKQHFQYAVKIVCGKSVGNEVVKGTYLTAVNIHNPADNPISFRRKVALGLLGEKPGPVTNYFEGRLGPDQTIETACAEITRLIQIKSDFFDGFLVIESESELDVVAVYTASGSTGEVETLYTERVRPRRVETCPDLVVVSIEKPTWDESNKRTVIRAVIKNIGTASAGPTIARVIDPSTHQPTGAPYNAIADTPALAPGASVTVVFYLPYWVYNPDASLEVTADYKDMVQECNENNNTRVFSDIG